MAGTSPAMTMVEPANDRLRRRSNLELAGAQMVPPARRRHRRTAPLARELGLHRISYQGPPKTASPHYDITALERRRAIAYGAMAVDRTTIVMVLHRLRRQVATSIRHPEVRDTDLGFTRDRHNRAQIGYNRLEGAPRRMTGTDSAAIHPSRLAANAARSSG